MNSVHINVINVNIEYDRDMVQKKRRGEYHHPDLRTALIEAAVEIIAREGSRALTLREVTRRAGVSAGAPYRHFADREALIAAVAEAGFKELYDRMRDHMKRAGKDHQAALTECGVAYVLFAIEHPAHFQVMFTDELAGEHPSLDSASSEAFAVLRAAVSNGQDAKVFRGSDATNPALAAWSVVHGLATLLVARRVNPPPSVAALTRQVIDLCIEGVLR